jgi:hypothetical protein
MPATEARALLNDDKIWRSYFKFAFDRNPWDRQVSFYHHRYRGKAEPSALLRLDPEGSAGAAQQF